LFIICVVCSKLYAANKILRDCRSRQIWCLRLTHDSVFRLQIIQEEHL